jgi:acyl-CoA reductase-like NAD-dependent aldehyde dehydrogenase
MAAVKQPDWIERSRGLKLSVNNLINGHIREVRGETIDKLGPRDGRLLVRFGAGESDDVREALASARQAFEDGRWSDLPNGRRKQVLFRLAELIETHAEELALLEALDVGKPITAALSFDLPATVACIRFCAEAVDKFYGRVFGVDRHHLSFELHRPLGVVAGIVGWNFPLLLAASKIGPALATGNSLVLKPSELTSLSAVRMGELALQAGVPEGIFNVIHGGPNLGAALARHPEVDLVSFTGSSATGKKILAASGESNMKRLVLECGGKAPNIVFDDSPDLEKVADAVVRRAFYNQGEVCSASSRLLVQESIRESFLPVLIRKTSALSPGDPLRADTSFGALVSDAHRKKVLGYVENAEREGTHRLYESSAKAPVAGGFYVPPVIFDRVAPHQKIAQEEIFGPVLSVISFRDEEEAIRIANSTIYGLSAVAWTRDLGRAHRITHGIHAGWIVVNATGQPLGADPITVGGQKQSGLGVEGGVEGIAEYTRKSAVQWFV